MPLEATRREDGVSTLEALRVPGDTPRVRKTVTLAMMLVLACSAGNGAGSMEEACTLACTGAHEVCVSSAEGPTCACAAGYEGDPCTWGTVPQDPGFAEPDVWSDEAPGVELLTREAGLDPGIALLDETAVCDGGTLSQVVQMPGSEVGDAFVVEMVYRTDSLPPLGRGVEVYAGNALRTIPVANGRRWTPIRFCLGEAAYGSRGATYGGPVEFRIGVAERDNECTVDPKGTIEVDRFQILVAGPDECPEPGTVMNGSAEVDGGGWRFDLDDVVPGEGVATAALEPGVGRDGSGGARIYLYGGANIAGMGTRFSVPLPSGMDTSPALQFWWRADTIVVVPMLGPRPEANYFPTYLELLEGESDVRRYCLPPWTYGSVVELWFYPLGGRTAGDFVVDDIELVSDERCGESKDLLDPHFDSAPNRWPGAIWGALGEGVEVVPGRGRSGEPDDGAAVLRYVTSNTNIVFNHWVLVPPAKGQEGPQLTFYSNLPADGVQVAGIVSRNSSSKPEDFLPAGVGWRKSEGYCLPRGWAGRWLRFRVEVRHRVGERPPMQIFDPPKEVLLDDFELGTSAGCTE